MSAAVFDQPSTHHHDAVDSALTTTFLLSVGRTYRRGAQGVADG